MPLMTVEKCWRGRTDCESFASVEAVPEGITDEQKYTLDFDPKSFVCCGCVKAENRIVQQDAYRLCFKNDAGDEMTDNDEQDLTHVQFVISSALACVASRRVNCGTIDAPTELNGGMATVATMQDGGK